LARLPGLSGKRGKLARLREDLKVPLEIGRLDPAVELGGLLEESDGFVEPVGAAFVGRQVEDLDAESLQSSGVSGSQTCTLDDLLLGRHRRRQISLVLERPSSQNETGELHVVRRTVLDNQAQTGSYVARVGVVGAENLLVKRQDLDCCGLASRASEKLPDLGADAEDARDLLRLVPKCRAKDRKSPGEQRLGLFATALMRQRRRKIGQDASNRGMIFPQRILQDCDALAEKGLAFVEMTLFIEHSREGLQVRP
jgi:hypothetical protein